MQGTTMKKTVKTNKEVFPQILLLNLSEVLLHRNFFSLISFYKISKAEAFQDSSSVRLDMK